MPAAVQPGDRQGQGEGFNGQMQHGMRAEPPPEQTSRQPAAAEAHQQRTDVGIPTLSPLPERDANCQQHDGEQHG